MKRHITQLALASFFVLSFLAMTVHGVSALSEFIGPDQIVVKAGTASSTSMSYLTGNDSQYMTFASNKSGDKNYYESYKIESDSDIASKYFNITQSQWNLPVEFKDEKADSSYNSHKKVIRIQDKYSLPGDQLYYWVNQYVTQRHPIHNDSALNVDSGWFEFYFMSEATNGTFMITLGDSKSARVFSTPSYTFRGYNHGMSFGITPLDGSASQFFWQSNWTMLPIIINRSAVQYQPNKWYHVRLGFHFNNSWAIKINGAEVYNSSTWNINSTMKLFNTVSMMTAIRTAASYHDSHVYYIDAMGLSYNVTGHNAAVTSMQFNADYVPLVDINSHNNLNDHVANASFVAYFVFKLRDLLGKSSSAKLFLQARYSSATSLSWGMIRLFDWTTKTYTNYANYTNYSEFPPEEFTFAKDKNSTVIINSSRYVDPAGTFSMKIEAQSNDNFVYIANYIVVEFVLTADMSQVFIVILAVLGVVVVYILYQVTRRGAPRARAGARKARRNLR